MSAVVQFSKSSPQKASSEAAHRPAALDSIRIIHGRFVFDERRGSFHRVSESAAFVLGQLRQGAHVHTIISDYARHYDISTTIAQRDVELFVNDLPQIGLQASGKPPRPKARRTKPAGDATTPSSTPKRQRSRTS